LPMGLESNWGSGFQPGRPGIPTNFPGKKTEDDKTN
jgi:hypothetical protein